MQFLQIHRTRKVSLKILFPQVIVGCLLSHSPAYAQILKYLTHALNAQAVSLEFGSGDGQSGWSPSGAQRAWVLLMHVGRSATRFSVFLSLYT